jgi:hypothetical protein
MGRNEDLMLGNCLGLDYHAVAHLWASSALLLLAALLVIWHSEFLSILHVWTSSSAVGNGALDDLRCGPFLCLS